MRQIRWKRIAVFIGGWILLAFTASGLGYFTTTQVRTDRTPGWGEIFLWQVIFYAWGILSPLIILFARRFRFDRQSWWRVLPAHLAAAFCFLLLHEFIYALFRCLINCEPPAPYPPEFTFFQFVWTLFLVNWLINFPIYCLILSTIYVVDFYRRLQAEQVKSSELRAALARSQLQALKMQIHPHFLFNTLNSISALIHEDARAADRMIARLGDFLRLTLESSGEQEVSFKKEMDFVNCYLEIESVRFQDRLTIKREIEPETLTARVPQLILQPIIENAIRHGISKQVEAGYLIIRARKAEDKLQIEIEDNGPGLSPEETQKSAGGIGLANTRARLSHLYGTNYHFEVKNAASRGVIVRIEIPFEMKIESALEPETANSNERTTNQRIAYQSLNS